MQRSAKCADTRRARLGSVLMRLLSRIDDRRRLSAEPDLTAMLTAIWEAPGRARLLGLGHMMYDFGWLYRVDRAWTEKYLVVALRERSESSAALWEALSRFGLRRGVPRCLAGDVVERAEGSEAPRLSRRARQRLLSALVSDALQAFFRGRTPVVDSIQLQQLIRRLDAESRGHCVAELRLSLRGVGGESPRPEEVFRKAVAPFLKQIWPQERSLVSVGVSRWMASIPAASRGEFVAAVGAVERFLAPVTASSLIDCGLYGEENGTPLLATIIDTAEKAGALLHLLDLTIGHGGDARTPYGIGDLLSRIRKKAPELVERPEFTRLTMLAQRSRFE